MAKNKNQQTQTPVQKQTQPATNQNQQKQNNTPAKPVNDVVALLDFYRKAGYDYVDIALADGRTATIVLNDITTLAVKSTLTDSQASHTAFEFVSDSWYTPKQPVHIHLNSRAFVATKKDISGASFAADIHHVTKAANEFLVEKRDYHYRSTKPEMREFSISDALDYLDDRITKSWKELDKTQLFITNQATKIVYQDGNYLVFQNLYKIEDDWQVGELHGRYCGENYKIDANIQKREVFGGADIGLRTDQILTLVPRKDRMKIADKEILDWIVSKKEAGKGTEK